MKSLKLILFAMIVLYHNCELPFTEENIILQEEVIGVWYLRSYTREDQDGVLQTISPPYDVALLFEDETYVYEQNVQHFRIIELYVRITETTIECYYKVDFKEINLDTNEEKIFINGTYFDNENIETYYIGEDGILLSSNESISGMEISYNNNELEISGDGEIVLVRTSENEIINISSSNNHELEMCKYFVKYVIYEVYFE